MGERSLSQFLLISSVAAVVLAAFDSLGFPVWLAATQWLLTAAVLGVWAVWAKVKAK